MAEGITIARLGILRLGAGRLAYAPAIDPPQPPLLIAPVDLAVHQALTPLFDWAPDPDDIGPFRYDLYLGTEPDPPLAVHNIELSEFQGFPLLGDATYFWRVVVFNPAGFASSEIRSFSTGPRFAAILVNGVDVSLEHVSANVPVRYEDLLDGRSTLAITFDTTIGALPDLDGAEIVVLDGTHRVFGGMLIEPEERVEPSTDRVLFTCQATDYSAICDRRLVARAYTNRTLDEIVVHIVVNDMGDEGIDVSGVEPGPRIVKAVFNWISATEAFNQLAELTGMAWWIDPYRVLHFRERSSIPAVGPFTPQRVGSITVRPDRQVYRNHQIIRFSGGLTDVRTESFVGDGERQTFTTAFAGGTEPSITVNGVAKTVGIKGVEHGFDWYWNKGEPYLTQDDSLAPLSTSDVLAVTYQGLFDGIVSAASGPEISHRRAIEGGSGRYMSVEERGHATQTTEAAIQVAQATLDRYATIGRVLTVKTEIPGYAPGQLVPVTLPDYHIDGELFLIETVSGEIPPGVETFWYTIRALSGDPYGGWQTYFRRLQASKRQYVLNDNEVVIGLNQWGDSVRAADALTASALAAPETRIGFARIGYSVIGGPMTYRDHVLVDGAVGYWRLGETSGTAAQDELGGATGTISGGVTLGQPGVVAGDAAMAFDAPTAAGKVTVATGAAGAFGTGPFSLELWLKTTQARYCFPVMLSGAGVELAVQTDSAAVYFTFIAPGNPPQPMGAPFPFNDNAWHHVACVIRRGTQDVAELYIDGVWRQSFTLVAAGADFTCTGMLIGRHPDPDPIYGWNGLLDEVAIYHVALTAAQIAAHYTSGMGRVM